MFDCFNILGSGWLGWAGHGLGMIMILGSTLFAGLLLWHHLDWRKDPLMQDLKLRYACGDMTREEYQRIRRRLR